MHSLRRLGATSSSARGLLAAHRLEQLRWLSPPKDVSSSLELVRDFIHRSLYAPHHGYFTRQAAPVGFLGSPIDFSGLAGQRAYLAEVQRRYKELQVAWLTPAEIFSPHYGAAFASYLAQQHEQATSAHRQGQQPLRVYEVGGGTGTFARDVLGWLRTHRPAVYASCHYTSVEISPALGELQRQRVGEEAGHGGRFGLRLGDAAQLSTWGGPSAEPCFVVMMEVLDNLPHDRVWREGAGAAWHETLVGIEHRKSGAAGHAEAALAASPGPFQEVLAPLDDDLILRCLHAWERSSSSSAVGSAVGTAAGSVGGVRAALLGLLHLVVGVGSAGEAAFLPTGALQLFDVLHAARPGHRLVAADFDHLPETSVEGWNAPLVATTQGGRTVDHATYLVQPGTADIFFPSSFELLRQLYSDAGDAAGRKVRRGRGSAAGADVAPRREVRCMKTRQFVERYAPGGGAAAATRDGYNPLALDYSNTAVLVS